MRKSAHRAVQKRYARWPMASPRAKYSNSASRVTKATARATIAVEPHNTRPTTTGISTAAVATRFHVIEEESPEKEQASSHHIEWNKSRSRQKESEEDQRRRINAPPHALASRQELRLRGWRRSGVRAFETPPVLPIAAR